MKKILDILYAYKYRIESELNPIKQKWEDAENKSTDEAELALKIKTLQEKVDLVEDIIKEVVNVRLY